MNLDLLVRKHLPAVLELRHELHRHPELAGEEIVTSRILREKLRLPGLSVRPPLIGPDVIALLNDGPGRKNLTLRADIDGLPIQERTGLPYASVHPGRMHGCGHDGHTAMLYGALLCLLELRAELRCSVRFLFQPGEEVRAMAKRMVEAGALTHPRADFIAGIHNWPHVAHGCISSREGSVMAAAGFFRIRIVGKGGHGSLPLLANNPLIPAAEITLNCAALVPPGCVLSVCRIAGGENSNIIPGTAELEGTLRYTDVALGEKLLSDFEAFTEEVCSRYGVKCEFSCDMTYPVTSNSRSGHELARRCALKYLGADGFTEMPSCSMSSEDFAYYLQKTDGCYCHLGASDDSPSLHSDTFDFDDSLLERGMRFFIGLALEFP